MLAEVGIPALVTTLLLILGKLVDNLIDRRKANSAMRRADNESALGQVQAVWAELRALRAEHEAEIEQLREDHKAEIAELKTLIELHRHQKQTAELKAIRAEHERDDLLRRIAPLEQEVQRLRERIKELEALTGGNH